MNIAFTSLLCLCLTAAEAAPADNPLFQELVEKGVAMSDGTRVVLPKPFLSDGLDASQQQAALQQLCAASRLSPAAALRKSSAAPISMKVRTVRASENESPAVRTVDFWFVAYGDWKVLNSEKFLESFAPRDEDDGERHIVSKSGFLSEAEMAQRKLTLAAVPGEERRFVYTTFSLFDRVELSATRFAILARGPHSVLAAATVDPRFAHDKEYPNQWRLMLRDERAEIQLGPPHTYAGAGGYAKITALTQPADAVLVECHLAYEEPYAWFDGANLVKQKAPLMVQDRARTFRRKLAIASQKQD